MAKLDHTDNRANSLWDNTIAGFAVEADASYPTQDFHRTSWDLVVIGGGFTGLRAALEAARAGQSVLLLESGALGHGASGRNGGQVNPLPPIPSPDFLAEKLGLAGADLDRGLAFHLRCADELFGFIAEERLDCQARQLGWVRTHHCASVARTAEAMLPAWQAAGADIDWLEDEAIHDATGTRRYQTAYRINGGGLVQPLALLRGIARRASEAGAVLAENRAVTGLERRGQSWGVTFGVQTVEAQKVLVASNAYATCLLPELLPTFLALTPIQIATEPLSLEDIGPILSTGASISDTRRHIMYARREPSNRIVYGGVGVQRSDGRIVGHDRLIADALHTWPQLTGVAWPHRWGGRIAITPNHLPHLFSPGDGLLVAFGYSGRGVALSNALGKRAGRYLVTGDLSELPMPLQTPDVTLRMRVDQWLLPFASTWMRIRDALDQR